MVIFPADIGAIKSSEIERLHESLRRAMSIHADTMAQVREANTRMTVSMIEPTAHVTRMAEEIAAQIAETFAPIARWNEQMAEVLEPVARWSEQIAEAIGPITRWGEQMTEVLAPVAAWGEHLAEALAPFLEEQRVAQVILHLGLLPHAEMIRLLAGIEKPSEENVTETAERIAVDLWPKLRPILELSLSDCLDDEKIFRSFNELVRAHDAGLYQLTTPAAASVIERAVRLAQRHGTKTNTPIHWLEVELLELPCTHVRSWRVLSVLSEQTYAHCRTDAEADTIQYPNRHAAAHGFGARTSTVVDSFNAVMAAHFVITAASAYEKYTVGNLH